MKAVSVETYFNHLGWCTTQIHEVERYLYNGTPRKNEIEALQNYLEQLRKQKALYEETHYPDTNSK